MDDGYLYYTVSLAKAECLERRENGTPIGQLVEHAYNFMRNHDGVSACLIEMALREYYGIPVDVLSTRGFGLEILKATRYIHFL